MLLESPPSVLEALFDEGLEAILSDGFPDGQPSPDEAEGLRRVFAGQKTVRGELCDVEVHEVSPCTGAKYVVVVQPARSAPDQRDLRRRFQLTRQQAQVALLLNERRSDREIAQALCIALNTASNHVKIVRDKLDARSRREVPGILRAIRQDPVNGATRSNLQIDGARNSHDTSAANSSVPICDNRSSAPARRERACVGESPTPLLAVQCPCCDRRHPPDHFRVWSNSLE